MSLTIHSQKKLWGHFCPKILTTLMIVIIHTCLPISTQNKYYTLVLLSYTKAKIKIVIKVS